MSDIPEAIGTAVVGAAAARAVEPSHGRKGETPLDHGHFHESACLNCHAPLTGPYCNQCGQAAHLHRTMGAFLHDISHSVLHLEGKTWRTLPMLFWRPGELTRRYIDGERARFVSPMALFLFSVFAMFAVFQFSGLTSGGGGSSLEAANVLTDTGEGRDAIEQEVARQRAALEAMAPNDPERAGAEQSLKITEAALTGLENSEKIKLGEIGPADFTLDNAKTGWKALDEGIAQASNDPSLLFYKLQTNSYKFSWLLIVLSVPFVWLIFAWKRRFGLYDHAVFVTYSIAFMSLLFIVLATLANIGVRAGWITTAALTVPLWHIHRHLRGAYQLSRFSAVWRTIALLVVITIVLTLFLTVLLLLGLLS